MGRNNLGGVIHDELFTTPHPGGVISPKPVITPPKHIKSDATGKTRISFVASGPMK